MCGRWPIFDQWLELSATGTIIESMRRFVLLVMILLLPLRGWAGAVMSVDMSMQSVAAVPVVASSAYVAEPAHAETVKSGADCPDHSAMQAAGEASSNGSSHCNTRVACQICHTVALTGITPLKLAPLGADSPIALGVTRFASVALASGFKPPIS